MAKRVREEDDGCSQAPAAKHPKLDSSQATVTVESSKTGIVYDARMRYHFSLPDPDPTSIGNTLHPEDPKRIAKIMQALIAENLVYVTDISLDAKSEYPTRIDAREVRDEELLLVHNQEHINFVKSLKSMTVPELLELSSDPKFDSIYYCRGTALAASLAAGGTVDLCKAVMSGKLRNGFAIVRPPGHHAEHDEARGFCMYNNVSVAANVLLADPDMKCGKIMIVDWDIHHGNGIQAAHYQDNRVLYLSLHRNDSGFYPTVPATRAGHEDRDNATYGDQHQCGEGKGRGFNVNIPWSSYGMGDGDYIHAFERVVLPVAREFAPDIILVASGFDAADGDPLGACFVSDGAYAYLTHQLMGIGSGKVVVVLEGGYNMLSISVSAVAVVKALMGRTLPRLPNSLPTPTGLQDINNVVQIQSKYWSQLRAKNPETQAARIQPGIHEIIRQWQISQMWDRHCLYPLFVRPAQVSRIYHNSVLATPEFGARQAPLLFIIHEPADPLEGANPISGEDHYRHRRGLFFKDSEIQSVLDKSDDRIIENTGSYIEEAIRMGYDVVDVHLPNHEAVDEESDAPAAERKTEVANLMEFIFDHHIIPSRATHIVLMGTEAGHAAINDYLVEHENFALDRVDKVIHFVHTVPVQGVRSHGNDLLARWYHSESLVFVAPGNLFWKKSEAQRLRRKWGSINMSDRPHELKWTGADPVVPATGGRRLPATNVSFMLREHHAEVMAVLSEFATVPDYQRAAPRPLKALNRGWLD